MRPIARDITTPSSTKSDSLPSRTAQARTVETSDAYVAGSAPMSQPLPPEVFAAKQAVMNITRANTERTDNIADVRAQLEPHLDMLATHFAKNRPSNEVELTRGSWKSLWYDDPDINTGPGPLILDRSKIWQVVKDGFYYNVSEAKVSVFGKDLLRVQSYLRGNYEIIDPASPATQGQPRRNVIRLTFDENRARLGRLPKGTGKSELVDEVVRRERFTIGVPGPKGVSGELWNLYVDKDLRISAGTQEGASKSTQLDLYILQRD